MRLKILQRASERSEFEDRIYSRECNLLTCDATITNHDVDFSDDAILTAKKMGQRIEIELEVKPRPPVAQKRLDEASDFRSRRHGSVPFRIIYLKCLPINMSERGIHKLMLDTISPEVDQFAMVTARQEQVIQKLSPMVIVQMINRLKFKNGSLVHEQVDVIRLAEIDVLDLKTSFRDSA